MLSYLYLFAGVQITAQPSICVKRNFVVDANGRVGYYWRMKSLRTIRQENGLTLVQASVQLGIDTGNLSRIERGIQVPSLVTASALADFYKITLDQVYGRKVST